MLQTKPESAAYKTNLLPTVLLFLTYQWDCCLSSLLCHLWCLCSSLCSLCFTFKPLIYFQLTFMHGGDNDIFSSVSYVCSVFPAPIFVLGHTCHCWEFVLAQCLGVNFGSALGNRCGTRDKSGRGQFCTSSLFPSLYHLVSPTPFIEEDSSFFYSLDSFVIDKLCG